MDIEVGFSLEGPDLAERNDATSDLQDFLASRSEIPIRRVKEDMTTQDSGTLLVAVLAAPAVVELVKGPLMDLAKGIADWLQSRNGTIKFSAGEIKVENVRHDQVLAAHNNHHYARFETGGFGRQRYTIAVLMIEIHQPAQGALAYGVVPTLRATEFSCLHGQRLSAGAAVNSLVSMAPGRTASL